MTFGEIAGAAYFPPDRFPLDILEPGLEETAFFDPVNFTFPGGCHVAEVEIDPDTGELALDRRLSRLYNRVLSSGGPINHRCEARC
jgi:aerobic carbon-monoxide dehydrogenase large subunit